MVPKNKPNSKPIAGLRPEIRNELNECYLKKQSQFVSYCVLRDAYSENEVEKTKPISRANK
jgi:hypothetical protein